MDTKIKNRVHCVIKQKKKKKIKFIVKKPPLTITKSNGEVIVLKMRKKNNISINRKLFRDTNLEKQDNYIIEENGKMQFI